MYTDKLKEDMDEIKRLGYTDEEVKELRSKFQKMEALGKDAFEAEQAEAVAALN